MKYPHLWSFVIAVILFFGGGALGLIFARRIERHHAAAYAGRPFDLKILGSALPRAALDRADLLITVGASEVLDRPSLWRAGYFFRDYATGFCPFEIAQRGLSALTIAQVVAGLGNDLRDKRIVVSYTPEMFTGSSLDRRAYRAAFSLLHAHQIVFNPSLSVSTRRDAARRMLHYRGTLKHSPLLLFAMKKLVRGGALAQFLYYLSLPLGKLEELFLGLQDHALVLHSILADHLPAPKKSPHVIDWNFEQMRALRAQKIDVSSNEFGVQNSIWEQHYRSDVRAHDQTRLDQRFLSGLRRSVEWRDFDILLRILRDLGAKPLIIGRPMKGVLDDARGPSASARQVFYERMQDVVRAYRFPLVDFHEFDGDPYFVDDALSHTSREGWVYVDRVMDDFFHKRLGE